ncbi:alanine racemase [Sphingobacterium sp. SYP-B4668]|uniref:alanine racemase n=1 Tax=Sphingobacterium sp. SYP-B4668 TaxID=2996035 RepID=UPI0022DD5731|nr:alanine racemase [Sphingobacterium sp. SYP-B4668]
MKNKLFDRYRLIDSESVTTPNILAYPDSMETNICRALQQVSNPTCLRPHIKTVKCAPIVQLYLNAGVTKFKCATLKEAELLAAVGVPDLLIAYPLLGPNVAGFMDLILRFPETRFQVTVDSLQGMTVLNHAAAKKNLSIPVFIDINLGMNRTGINIEDLEDFGLDVSAFANITLVGIHGYDGHIRERDLGQRERIVQHTFGKVLKNIKHLEERTGIKLTMVFGGSNTFPIYARYPFVECSPGTFILWDYGYHMTLPEQHFDFGALIIARIISRPAPNIICIDLGYKAIASENELVYRLHVLDYPDWKPISQSEEHLLFEIPEQDSAHIFVGQLLYIVPYHICPTVAMYPAFQVVKAGVLSGQWSIQPRY